MGAICGGDRGLPKDTPPEDDDAPPRNHPHTLTNTNSNTVTASRGVEQSDDNLNRQTSTDSMLSATTSPQSRLTKKNSIPSASSATTTATTTLKTRYSKDVDSPDAGAVATTNSPHHRNHPKPTQLLNNTSNTSNASNTDDTDDTAATSNETKNNTNTKNNNTNTSSNNSSSIGARIRRNSSLKGRNRNDSKNGSKSSKNSKNVSDTTPNDSDNENNSNKANNRHNKSTSSTGAKLAQSIAKSIRNSIKHSSSQKLDKAGKTDNLASKDAIPHSNSFDYERQYSVDSANHNETRVFDPVVGGVGGVGGASKLDSTTATPATTSNVTNLNKNDANGANGAKKTRFAEVDSPSVVDTLLVVPDEMDNDAEMDEIEISESDKRNGLHSIQEDSLLDENLQQAKANAQQNSIPKSNPQLKRPPSVDIATKTLNQANLILAQSPKSLEDQIEDMIKLYSSSAKRAKYIFLQSAFFTKAGTSGGKTKENQDSYFAYDKFGPGDLFQFYGVADGHGRAGHKVSRYVTDLFPKLIVRNPQSQLLLLKDTKLALKKAFLDLEMRLYDDIANKRVTFDIEYSGTTLTCGLRFGNTLYLGNLGDSRTILGKIPVKNFSARKRMTSVPLSVDHDPSAPEEMERIKNFSNAKINYDEDGYARIDIAFTHDLLNSPDTNNLGTLGTFGATREDADEKDSKDIVDEFLDDTEIQSLRSKQAAMRKVSQRRTSLSPENNNLNISVTDANGKSGANINNSNGNNSGGSSKNLAVAGAAGAADAEDGEDIINRTGSNLLRPEMNIDYSNNKYIPPPRKSKLIKNLKKISSSVSRSFGDRIAHKYGGLITEPDIRVYEFGEQDCFVIWASDGIWSMLDNSEVTDIVSKKLMESHGDATCDDLNKVIKKLVITANGIWIDECEGYTDDITAVIARIGKRTLLYPNETGEDVIDEEIDILYLFYVLFLFLFCLCEFCCDFCFYFFICTRQS